ncbi:MAG: hypothetical protein ACRCW0_08045 [Clostridium sp.]
MIDREILQSKNYYWLEEVSDTGLRDKITKGKQYEEVKKFFESEIKLIKQVGYKVEDFINDIVIRNGTIHVIKNKGKIVKKLIYLEDVNNLNWANLIKEDLEDKSVFIIPENPL